MGAEVKQVQNSLNRAGGSALPKLAEDGIFGPKTRARVVEFQKARGLVTDGIVGPKTRAALDGGVPVPGGGLPPKPAGVPKSVVNAVVSGTQTALVLWKATARFQGITITGPMAMGGPGCLVGTSLSVFILSQPQIASLTGDDRLVAIAAAQGVGDVFKHWQSSVTVPGLPWYPSFAMFPAPAAPPTPNIPTPLIMLPSAGKGALTSPAALQAAMASQLGPDVKARDTSGKHTQTLAVIAAQLGGFFAGWLGSQMVANVLGRGPVPMFAPPLIPAGPVQGGSILPSGGHLP
jgi:hypothetical protein